MFQGTHLHSLHNLCVRICQFLQFTINELFHLSELCVDTADHMAVQRGQSSIAHTSPSLQALPLVSIHLSGCNTQGPLLHHAALPCTTQLYRAPHSSTVHHTALPCTTQLYCAPRSSTVHHAALPCTTQLYCAPRSSTMHHTALLCTTQVWWSES